MKFIKAKFVRQDKPCGRSYTYRTEDETVKDGDYVTDAKGSKLIVTDESVDMEWVQTYGAENVAIVTRFVEQESEGKCESI